MLSKKMTFSLMSLITLIAFAFVAGDAFAAEKPFEIKITGRTTATYTAGNPATTPVTVKLKVESAQPIGDLTFVQPSDQASIVTTAGDFRVAAFDKYDNRLSRGTHGGSRRPHYHRSRRERASRCRSKPIMLLR